MANHKDLELLKKGVSVWNAFQRPVPADLSGTDLKHMDLSGINLDMANLSGADLRFATLESASLCNAELTDTKLCATNLRYADLQDANLYHANLEDADLDYVDLARADCRFAYLAGASLVNISAHGTNFSRANLTSAEITGANLESAIFYKAKLINTDMRHARLYGVILESADMTGATIGSTSFSNTTFAGIAGLDTLIHDGPSSIGIDTICHSGASISQQFLRNCGVPEPFVVYAESLISAINPVDFYSCFISYSHADKDFVRKLHKELQKHRVRCWRDEHQLLPGDDIYHEVDRGIRLWDKVLLCCSESSLKSWWVDNEIRTALEKESQLMMQRGQRVHVLIPLNLDGYFFDKRWNGTYQVQLRSRLAADFMGSSENENKFNEQIEKLIRALRADESAREKPPKCKL